MTRSPDPRRSAVAPTRPHSTPAPSPLESTPQATEVAEGRTPRPGWPQSPLAALRRTFAWLCTGPDPLRLDLGSAAAHLDTKQPVGGIAVGTLAAWLNAGEVSPAARDAVWARLIVRSWVESIPWRVVAVGVAEPALRALIEELLGSLQPPSPSQTNDDLQDNRDNRETGHENDHEVRHEVESNVLTGFLEGLASADLVRPGVWPRLLSWAREAGQAALRAERSAPEPIGLDPLAARTPGLSALLTMTAPVTSGGVAGVPLDVLLAGAVGAGALSEGEADVLRDAASRAKDPHAQGLPPRRAAALRRIEQRLADHLCHQAISPTTANPSIGPIATSTRTDHTDHTDPAPDDPAPDDPARDGDDHGGSGCQERARDGGFPAGELVGSRSSRSSRSSDSGTGSRHRTPSPWRAGHREPREDGAAGDTRAGEHGPGRAPLVGRGLRDRLTRWSLDRVGVGPGVLAVLVVLVVVALAAYVALYVALIWAVVTGVALGPLGPCLSLPGTPQPLVVSALLSPSGVGGLAAQAPIVPAGSVDAVLTNIRNFLMGILAALATVFATFGGVRYVMSGGEPGEVEKAKSALRSAAIGFALAALAPLVVEILRGLVGA